MPHINRIRVNNVRYNFGTQFYDDFIMRFSCKNTIYDLANGGGKSVLMLLLFQNLIPNCTLDDKQPVEKLFRTGSGSNTIHSLVEWKLDSQNVKNNYKYMLTGFCARKAREDENGDGDNATIEYFNYCIFYREFNDNDIKNLPLSNGRERITYNGLKSYLRELEKKDFSLEVKIFERKGEYQRFIADYGLYESQWEIIRGINKTEGHVRTYFETNYKTTRKVVEDLLIEEIIEKSFNNRVALEKKSEESMAKTLLDIKDKLIELSKRKEDIGNFDRQTEAIESFIGRVSGIRQLYFGREELEEEIIRACNTLNKIVDERQESLEKYTVRRRELEEEKRLLEKKKATIKVQKNRMTIKELNSQIKQLEDKLSGEKTAYKDKKQKLLMMESENDYIDYIYYKNERDSLKTAIESITSGNAGKEGDIMTVLQAMAAEKKRRNEAKVKEKEAVIEKEEGMLLKESNLLRDNQYRETALVQENSVSDYLIQECTNKLNALTRENYKEREKYELIMSQSVTAELDKSKQAAESFFKELEAVKESAETLRFKEREFEYRYADISESISELQNRQEELSGIRKELAAEKEKYLKLCELYGEGSVESLVSAVKEKNNEVSSEKEEIREQLFSLKKYADNLENGCPVGKSAELKTVYEYIKKFHGDVAVYGNEYISSLSEEEREQVVSALPVLPYSIVIKRSFAAVTADAGLKKVLSGDYTVPVIREDAIKNGEYLFDSSKVSFIVGNEELIIDGEALENEKKTVSDRVENLESKYERIKEAYEILQDDLKYLERYKNIYKAKMADNDRECQENRLFIKEKEKELEALKEERRNGEEQKQRLVEKQEELELKTQNEKNRYESLLKLSENEKKAEEYEKEIRSLKTKKDALVREYKDITAEINAVRDRIEYRKSSIQSMKKELEEQRQQWNILYRPYYMGDVEDENEEIAGMSDEQLDIQAKAYMEMISGAMTDLKDKQKLMENYDVAMEKALQAIDYKGTNLSDIEQRYRKGQVISHTKEELVSFRKLLEGVEKTINFLEDEVTKNRAARDKLEGAVQQGIETIEEKYGSFEEEKMVQSFEEENEKINHLMDNVQILMLSVGEKIDNLQKTSKEYIVLQRDMERIIENAGIVITDNEILYDNEVDLKEKIKEVSGKYDRFLKEIQRRKEELDYERGLLCDTLTALESFRLAEEIRDNVVMPQSIGETEQLIENLTEIISCIRLEKDRVEKNIQDMETIKENFENQCIQSCVNIKTELERLTKLSRINMDNEAVPILKLTIPYIREDAYKQHMSSYIDEIVKSADAMKNEEERIKYIKNQLSWKRLFSVIVTDMNSIKLLLYKRERIKEQSRYLRYEEAVGSTGQSQGIYIQFLIAIINYITSINSANTESRNLGKVVFIDNPFGAAKDIYIWEPIFKMLKTNNVQLIVPCRGATPAITGRFDVNYILGQKMIDGKQQTVVVEYYSNVENDNIEYEKLEFEQNTLSFI